MICSHTRNIKCHSNTRDSHEFCLEFGEVPGDSSEVMTLLWLLKDDKGRVGWGSQVNHMDKHTGITCRTRVRYVWEVGFRGEPGEGEVNHKDTLTKIQHSLVLATGKLKKNVNTSPLSSRISQ